jgi:hypothetical protein
MIGTFLFLSSIEYIYCLFVVYVRARRIGTAKYDDVLCYYSEIPITKIINVSINID